MDWIEAIVSSFFSSNCCMFSLFCRGTANDEMCNFYIMYYMEAKHAVSYTTCTQNANPEMFRNIPQEANIPIPVKPDMLKMAHGHHEGMKKKLEIHFMWDFLCLLMSLFYINMINFHRKEMQF